MAGLPKCSDAMTNLRATAGDAGFLGTNHSGAVPREPSIKSESVRRIEKGSPPRREERRSDRRCAKEQCRARDRGGIVRSDTE